VEQVEWIRVPDRAAVYQKRIDNRTGDERMEKDTVLTMRGIYKSFPNVKALSNV